LAEKGPVRIELFDLSGRLVSTLVNSFQSRGRYSIVFNGRDARGRRVSTGVYFLRFTAGQYQEKKKPIVH
jgi:5-hydroxyisourate hydrolase-like protein (transthyretin family)